MVIAVYDRSCHLITCLRRTLSLFLVIYNYKALSCLSCHQTVYAYRCGSLNDKTRYWAHHLVPVSKSVLVFSLVKIDTHSLYPHKRISQFDKVNAFLYFYILTVSSSAFGWASHIGSESWGHLRL